MILVKVSTVVCLLLACVAGWLWPNGADWFIFLVLACCFGCMWVIDWELGIDERRVRW